MSSVILKGRPTLLCQSKKTPPNTSFDCKESFSVPGCGAALHNRDCCGWEQGELITLLFEAWAALLCCASFKNDKRLSKESSFVLQHGSFACLNHNRPLRFVFCILGLCLSLGSTSRLALTDWHSMPREGHWPKHRCWPQSAAV